MKTVLRKISMALVGLMVTTSAAAAGGRASIKSNILGTVRHYMVYLPDGFHRETNRHYPVLYLLHGFTDDERSWQDKGQMDRVADELMATGEAQKMVIVMPCAGGPDTKNVWNGYFNMEGWAYHDFFYQELMPTLEKKYRIIGDRANRAVSGLSMGGGGCTVYAQNHTDLFSSCYAMSAWLTSQDTQLDPNNRQTYVTKAVHQNDAIKFVSNATNETIQKLRTVRWFIDIGDDDFLFDQDIQLYQTMRSKRIPCELRVRNGGHTWQYWNTALRTSLPFAAESFNK